MHNSIPKWNIFIVVLYFFISSEEVKIYQLHCSENSFISEDIYEAFSKTKIIVILSINSVHPMIAKQMLWWSSKEPNETVIWLVEVM